jgi:hypothetical protein
MRYRVNIIFVRGSVAALLPFLRSLLEHTDGHYRLVANGCTAAERSVLMAESAAASRRVEYHEGSVEVVLAHGEMLERLLELESGEYFVFVDSDVLAIGPASFDDLLPDETEAARCSALPLWHRPSERIAPAGFRILGGRFVGVEGSDVVVGCSYAAGYRTECLRAIVTNRKIRLARSNAADLPRDVREELARSNLDFDVYDTLKVANILLHRAGSSVSMVELDNIVHVGALSAPNGAGGRSLRRSLKALLSDAGPWLRIFQWHSQGLSWKESRSMCDLAARRRSAGEFVARLASGAATIDTAPGWCRDPRIFDALAALYQSPTTKWPRSP